MSAENKKVVEGEALNSRTYYSLSLLQLGFLPGLALHALDVMFRRSVSTCLAPRCLLDLESCKTLGNYSEPRPAIAVWVHGLGGNSILFPRV